ncbi:MAG: NTP transferase domain-containing protein [Acidobacteriota bacterium]
MNLSTRICGIILAAGASSRMGRDKALLPWPPGSDGTLLSAAISALQPFVRRIVVVAGRNAEALAPRIAQLGADLARNPAPERGQLSSIQTGLQAALEHGCDAAMLTPVDCPPLSAASLAILCEAFAEARGRGAWAVAPERQGQHGHPLLLGRELIEAFLAAPPTGNTRQVKGTFADRFHYVEVSDALLAVEVNTPEEYAALARAD